jgi:DNA-binding GntR family transcriptional regulator
LERRHHRQAQPFKIQRTKLCLGGGARAPKKFEQTKQAMRYDILQGRLTTTELDTMLEREISEKYSVSRDTARKARNAVLAEFVVDSERQNDN